jgi:hypothetical protein
MPGYNRAVADKPNPETEPQVEVKVRVKRGYTKGDFREPGELRCDRCELSGHEAKDCELGTISDWAARRLPVDIP